MRGFGGLMFADKHENEAARDKYQYDADPQ
jgi:hypothetical protein